ncbi:unnamed protein product [Adineta steineri]|uniref:Uncharacterized protein n=1 Tax=Adineta steineri TaxID=433720 RepID=A0A815CKH5_9BILA|nr:unnamed protein product [Adineta steineri]CAF1284055.1 unnamed protein product [Adineta steineri]CAF3682709.1 unnamed protein product [Adineta steineri]CAF3750736.1 unnamed protein product [Adineta steineri]
MLPVCNSHSMLMPTNPCMTGVQHVMVPMMPVQPVPIICPPSNVNMCLSTTIPNEYNSQAYGRFRHVERDRPSYRHAPFDWYRPPKHRYDVVHEDAAVVTLDGPMPIGDFYRYHIYGEGTDDYDYDDSSSYGTEEYDDDLDDSSYDPRGPTHRRQTRSDSYINDDDETIPNLPLNQQPIRPSNYSTLDPNRRNIIPSSSSYQRNRSTTGANDNDFDDAGSVNSTYGN